MSATLRRLLVLAAETDTLCESTAVGLRTRCLHCRTWLYLSEDGATIGAVTLEHIIPRSWFERPRIVKALFQGSLIEAPGHANDARNLALACERCNQAKGRGHDRKPADARAQEVVRTLWQTRAARYQAKEALDLDKTHQVDGKRVATRISK
jgi:5-methylcytosine-specific restriction endonuclease McrA